MRALLLAVASLAVALPAPVQAQSSSDVRFGVRSGKSFNHGGFGDHNRRRHRDRDGDSFLYPPEYQGDSAWKSDSFNDWWHDRPDRAYPRWVTNNQNCARTWWGGDSLRC